jgi:hypothetical protein
VLATARPAAPPHTENAITHATLSHTLDRSILIRADREVVFRFFTDTAQWAAWWGAGPPLPRLYLPTLNAISSCAVPDSVFALSSIR